MADTRRASWATRLADQPKGKVGGTVMEGVAIEGTGETTLVALGEKGLVVHLNLQKGFLQPGHKHEAHEAMGYVLSGRIRMVVDGEEAILTEGCGWVHPVGSWHITEALEPSQALEFHIPIRDDILERFGIKR